MSKCSNCGGSNADDMRFCGYCGLSLSSPDDAPERRMIAVLFSDLEDFTGFSTANSEDDIPALLDMYQTIVANEVQREGGYVAQFLGDGVMAYFGWPEAIEDAAVRAVQAGTRLAAEIRTLHESGDFPLAVRVGIHYGSGIMTRIGERDNLLLGQTSNIAARLQQFAPRNGCVVSADVNERLSDEFETHSLGSMAIKGVSDSYNVFAVDRRVVTRSRFDRAVDRGLSRFVGREEEVTKLGSLIAPSAESGNVVLLRGEPGVGKSRLIHQLRHQDTRQWFVSQCSRGAQDSPYFTVVDLISRAWGAEGETLVNTILASNVEVPDADGLVALLGVSQAQTLLTSDRVAAIVAPLLVPPQGSRVYAIEDVHWIDEPSREVLEQLPALTRNVSFLLSARPEFEGTLERTVDLRSLSVEETGALIGALIEDEDVARRVAGLVQQKTNGNPLFIEELLVMLDDQGFLQPGKTVDDELQTLPISLGDLLTARLDRLGPARAVLQRAAVIGVDFDTARLGALYESGSTALEPHLERLVAEGLIIPVDTEGEYLIKHGLIRDAAYNSLSRTQRESLHCRLARFYEEMNHQREITPPEMIGRQWEHGGQVPLAISCYQRAGSRMIERGLNREASAQARRCLDLIRTLPGSRYRDELELSQLILLGGSIRSMEGYASEGMRLVFEPALTLAERLDAKPEVIPLLYGRWTYFLARADSQTRVAADELSRYVAQSDIHAAPFMEVTANFVQGVTCFMEARHRDACEHLERALEIYQEADHATYLRMFGEDLGIYSSVWLQWVYALQGRVGESLAQCEVSRDIAERLNDAHSELLYLTFSTHVRHTIGDLEEVVRLCDATIETAMREGFDYYAYVATGSKGRAQLLLGDAESGQKNIDESQAFVDGIEHALLAVMVLVDRVQHAINKGDVEGARRFVDVAFSAVDNNFDVQFSAEAHGHAGVLAEHLGELDQAEAHYRKAIDVAHEQGSVLLEIKNGARLAKLLCGQDRRAEASAVLEPLTDTMSSQGVCPIYDRAMRVLDESREV